MKQTTYNIKSTGLIAACGFIHAQQWDYQMPRQTAKEKARILDLMTDGFGLKEEVAYFLLNQPLIPSDRCSGDDKIVIYPPNGVYQKRLKDVSINDWFKRKIDAKTTFIRNHYDQISKTYSASDNEDMNREVFLKGSTPVWVEYDGFIGDTE
mgnify:CR=1 FL=1